jgi:small GTP-binding protein
MVYITILGSSTVGKSSITMRFINGQFIEKYDPTIEDFYNRQIMIGDTAQIVQIMDTAGQEEYSSVADLSVKDCDGIVFVYSIENESSFDDVEKKSQRASLCNPNALKAIAANKCDLERERVIIQENLIELGKKIGSCVSMEVSAKTGTNIVEFFSEFITKLTEKKKLQTPKPKQRHCILS